MRALLRFGLVAFIACAPVKSDSVVNRTGADDMLIYEVQTERESYLGGEEVKAIVRIMNDTPSVVDVPDPATSPAAFKYFIIGPQYPEGKVFASVAAATDMLSVAPGSSEARRVSLKEIADLSVPGEYRLVSQLEWQGTKVRSKETSFRIGAMKPASIDLGFGARPLGAGEGEGAFIDASATPPQLYSFQFREVHPGIGEAQVQAPKVRLALAPHATDVSIPWSNAPFFIDLIRWTIWREGRSIKALPTSGGTPLSFQVAEELAYLVRPSLKPASEPVEVLAVSQDEKTAHLVRLGTKPDQPGDLLWSAPLPVKPQSITARLAPQRLGNRRHVALVAQTGNGLEIFHSRYTGQNRLEPFRSVSVGGAEPIAHAPVALFVDAAGIAHIAVLVTLDKTNNTVGIVEARFPDDPKAVSQPAVYTLGALTSAPTAVGMLYVDKDGLIARLDVVLALQDGRVLRTNAAHQLVPTATQGRPTSPILLVPGKEVTYMLHLTPERGLLLEPI